LNILVPNACSPTRSGHPAEMIEFLAQGTDQVGGVLAVGGFDKVIMGLGFCRLWRAGVGHVGRSNLKKPANLEILIKIPRYRGEFVLYENVGEFVYG
jgi:hypothetical protein